MPQRLRRNGLFATGLGLGALALVASVTAFTDGQRATAIAAFAAVGVLSAALVALAIVRGLERADARAKTLGLRRTLAGQRVAEANLNRTERLLRVGSFHLEAGTRTLACSSEMTRLIGGLHAGGSDSLDDLIARVHGDDRNLVRDQFQRALAGATGIGVDGIVLNFAFRVVLPTGAIRTIQLRATCEREARGRVRALYGVVHGAGDAVSRPDATGDLGAAFDAAAIPTALVGLTGADRGLLVRVNKAFSDRLGYPPADLVGERLAELGGPDYAAKIDDNLAELRALGSGSSCFEIRWTRPNGELVPLRLHQACVAGPDGEPRYAVIQLVEATDPRTRPRRRFDPRSAEISAL
jgi:PAS domain S-box-containing protein